MLGLKSAQQLSVAQALRIFPRYHCPHAGFLSLDKSLSGYKGVPSQF